MKAYDIKHKVDTFVANIKEFAEYKGITDNLTLGLLPTLEMDDLAIVVTVENKSTGIVCFGNTDKFALFNKANRQIFNLKNNWYEILDDFYTCLTQEKTKKLTKVKVLRV